MERENAETRVRDVEDQLAGLQDELRESSRTVQTLTGTEEHTDPHC